jgi:Domain of unknown function (DUF4743)
MSFLDHILRCNSRDLSRYVPFVIEGQRFGFVTPARAAILARHPGVFVVQSGHIAFTPALTTPDKRTAAVENIAADLVASGAFLTLKGESYAVKNAWNEPPRLCIDRALVPGFGFRAFGVHINGFVRNAAGLNLWIGTRSMSCSVEPGKLDNMVAGGQPAHLSLKANVIKECDEEAGLSAALAATARPVSELSYSFDTPQGLRVDRLFCYDLEMPDGHIPENRDGEISSFRLMPVGEVLDLVRSSATAFKFNVNLVILDFAIRHGVIGPAHEPDYEKIVSGLRQKA